MGQVVRILGPRQREFARQLLAVAPERTVVEFKPEGRTLDQNSALWPMLGDVALARPQGRVMIPDAWKLVFMGALGHETQWLDGLYPHYPAVPWHGRSSRLSKQEMSDLLSLIRAYGDENGVRWREPPDAA